MDMQVVLPEQALPAKLTLNPELRMSDDDYFEFCMANPNVSFERTAQGEIVIVPPAGIESSYRSGDVALVGDGHDQGIDHARGDGWVLGEMVDGARLAREPDDGRLCRCGLARGRVLRIA